MESNWRERGLLLGTNGWTVVLNGQALTFKGAARMLGFPTSYLLWPHKKWGYPEKPRVVTAGTQLTTFVLTPFAVPYINDDFPWGIAVEPDHP